MREALLNAVVHKDYSSGIPIQISVYDDQIVLWNPGGLPEDWTLKRLLGKHPSCPFNPLLANAFFRAGYIESWGRGIEKIQRECREHGIAPPVYDFGMAGLMLTFRANFTHLQVTTLEPGRVTASITTQETAGTAQETTQETAETTRKTTGTTQETAQETAGTAQETRGTAQETTQEKILALLRVQPAMTRRELAGRLGISDSGIKYHLERMKAAGLIRHVGPTKSGYWEVLQ
jgi:ATP-dependent DNA helicase RecG